MTESPPAIKIKSAKGSIGRKHTAGTGWAFMGVADSKVGFYLEDISHDGHFFADSIRVERIAVAGFSDDDGRRPRADRANHHVFGLGDCKEITPPRLVPLAAGSTDPLGYYAPRFKAAARYEMPDLLTEADQKLEIDLAFLFTDYNKDPSHEPGGILPAARIYPTLTFKVPGVSHQRKRPAYRRATAVQVLYRINIRLEDNGIGNQCGAFTDLEDIGPAGGLESEAATRGAPGSFTFLAAEKPVTFELAGRGIDHGTTGGWTSTAGWDNIHQYSHPAIPHGDPNDGFADQPFTPGLPYGGHIHWRWGASAATGTRGVVGGRQYGGVQGPGTPLIDDKLRNQNLEFAIVDLSGWFGQEEHRFLARIDQDPAVFLFRDFSDVWEDLRPRPGILLPSANIVIWVSITAWGPGWDLSDPGYQEFFPGSGVSPEDFPDVPHEVTFFLREWGGTLFPQGIFFPHEDETYFQGTWKKRAIRLIPGVKKAQFLPKAPERTWRR